MKEVLNKWSNKYFWQEKKSRPFRCKRWSLYQRVKAEQKNRSMPSIVRGPISWHQPQLVQEDLVMVQVILDQIQRGISIRVFDSRPYGHARSRWAQGAFGKWTWEKPCKRAMIQSSQHLVVKCRCRHQRYRETMDSLPKRSWRAMALASLAPVSHFTKC